MAELYEQEDQLPTGFVISKDTRIDLLAILSQIHARRGSMVRNAEAALREAPFVCLNGWHQHSDNNLPDEETCV